VGYIDSGADVTLLPRSFLKPLRIKNVCMRIGNKVFNAKIAVALIEYVPYILGREDVFDKFEIRFCQQERVVRFI
jgi:hypothetical protein